MKNPPVIRQGGFSLVYCMYMRQGIFVLVMCGVFLAAPAFAFSWYGPGSGFNFTGWVSGESGFGFSWPWGFLDNPQNPPSLPPINNPPVWIPAGPQVASVGSPLLFAITAYDPEGAAITYSAVSLPTGSAFNPATHIFSWTPTVSQVGTHRATFRASDRVRAADMTVSITVQAAGQGGYNPYWYGYQDYNQNQNPQPTYVTPVNRPPQFQQIYPFSVRAGQAIQFTVQAEDYEGDYLRYSATDLPSGALFDDRSHTFYWMPTGFQIGRFQLPFRVSDSRPDYVEMRVSVTVTDPNGYLPYSTCTAGPGPYYFNFYPPTAAREGDLYSYQVLGASGNINPITYRVVDGPPGLTIGERTGSIRWVPAFNQGGGPYPVRIAAYNNQCEAMKNFSITVRDVN